MATTDAKSTGTGRDNLFFFVVVIAVVVAVEKSFYFVFSSFG